MEERVFIDGLQLGGYIIKRERGDYIICNLPLSVKVYLSFPPEYHGTIAIYYDYPNLLKQVVNGSGFKYYFSTDPEGSNKAAMVFFDPKTWAENSRRLLDKLWQHLALEKHPLQARVIALLNVLKRRRVCRDMQQVIGRLVYQTGLEGLRKEWRTYGSN